MLISQKTLDQYWSPLPRNMTTSHSQEIGSKKNMAQQFITDFFKVKGVLRSRVKMALQIPSPVKKFGSDRIPYYFRVMSSNNQWRGIEYSIFEIVLKFLTVSDCQRTFARVCKQWKHLDFKMFCSYSSFKSMENARFSDRELKVVLKKGSKSLPHMRICKEIIRRDFRNQFKFFNQNIALQTKLADNLQVQNICAERPMSVMMIKSEGESMTVKAMPPKQVKVQDSRLFQTFKIKALGVNSTHNFISDKSFSKVCIKSQHSLEDLALKNAIYLSNQCLIEHLAVLKRLVRLDLSYSKQIDDSVVKVISTELRNLKMLCLRFLSLITAESVAAVLNNLKLLEGIDISGCFAVNLDIIMVKLRENNKLKCLLLEYLFIQPHHLYHLRTARIQTLSLFYSRTVSCSHSDVLRQIISLTHLNVKDCPLVTEEGNLFHTESDIFVGLFQLLEGKEGNRFEVVQMSTALMTERVRGLLL